MLKFKFDVTLCNRVWTTLEINETSYTHDDESKRILKIAETLYGVICNYVTNDRLYLYDLRHNNIITDDNRAADQFIEYITDIYNNYKDSPKLCLYKLTNVTHNIDGIYTNGLLSIVNTKTREYIAYCMDSAPYSEYKHVPL